MAASDYVPKLSKYRLHPKGRPQMGSALAGYKRGAMKAACFPVLAIGLLRL